MAIVWKKSGTDYIGDGGRFYITSYVSGGERLFHAFEYDGKMKTVIAKCAKLQSAKNMTEQYMRERGGRKQNPINGNWGYTIWINDKYGTGKSKQVTGYPDRIAAIQGAYIAMQKPNAHMPEYHNAVIFDRTGLVDKGKFISPPNSSETLSFKELRRIVETQSPEFTFGRKQNPTIEDKAFTPAQLKKVKNAYKNAGMPSVVSDAFLKIESWVNALSDKQVEQLRSADIKIISAVANSVQSKRRKPNPVPEGTRSKLKKASALYENFRDKPATHINEYDQPDFSTGMVIGRLTAVEYDTVRGNNREDYRHKFGKRAAPLLCVTSDGKTLFCMEGRYNFTERGIVDEK